MTTRLNRIRSALESAFRPEHLAIHDDSHQHVGHAGAATGRGHFTVEIVAAAFAGQPLVTRHRMVYDALGALMETDIHAVSIKARAPGE